MNPRVRFAIVTVCGLLALAILGIFVRNYEFESAARALKAGEYSKATLKLKILAHLGDGSAQYILGGMYATGVGVEKNDSEAIRWFRRAAIRTHGESDPAAAAELAVARDYAEGIEGVKPDPAESLKWLRRAAEGGSKEAIRELQEPHNK